MAEDPPAHEILQRLFDIIIAEARSSPALARKLLRALPSSMTAGGEPAPRTPKFDASEFHAVNILRGHGENVLRGKLEQVRSKDNLRAIAKVSSLTLEGAAAKRNASLAEIIEGIIAAAKHYDKQRTGAVE
jgi:hypothetical protein